MKKIFILLLFMPCWCMAQQRCDSGWSFMPSISTSSLQIIADTCLPDSIYEKLSKAFAENMCGEGGLYIGNERTSYDRSGTWNDSTGCTFKEVWKKKVKKKWVEISEAEYYELNPNHIRGKILFGEAGIIEDTIPNLTGTNEFYNEPTYATPPPYTISDSTLKRLISEGKIDTTPIEEIYKSIARSQGWDTTRFFIPKIHDTVPKRIRPTYPEPAKPERKVIKIENGKQQAIEFSINNDVIVTDRIIMHFPDSSIEVKGDTMKILKMIYKKLLECQEKSKNDQIIIESLFNTIKSKATIQTKYIDDYPYSIEDLFLNRKCKWKYLFYNPN